MATESEGKSDSITLSKGTIYGIVVAALVILLVASIFTQGFGLFKTPTTVTPPTGNTGGNGGTTGSTGGTDVTQPAGPTQLTKIPALPTGNYPALGEDSATATIIEFSDFQCPFCGKFYTESEGQIKSNYIDSGKAKLYYRDFPLPFHPNAEGAAEAASCANEQGKFWEYHNKLFVAQSEWSNLAGTAVNDKFKEYAVDLGLNGDKFETCATSKKYADAIQADYGVGQQYGVSGTPSFFITIPKTKVTKEELIAVVDPIRNSLPPQQRDLVIPFEDESGNYGVMIAGAFPYSTFKSVLDLAE